jgi:hypothetical protein
MSQIVYDCPRCGAAHTTLDVTAVTALPRNYAWQSKWEVFARCRACLRSSILIIALNTGVNDRVAAIENPLDTKNGLNEYYRVEGYISLKDRAAAPPPDHVPDRIASIFREGAMCIAVGCWNAAGTMFRLCVDLTTQSMLPADDDAARPPWKVCRDLGLRIPWLFDNGRLPEDLRDLSQCIQQDGNDGAHAGTLTKEEAADLQDFTNLLLVRLYTEPGQRRVATERRAARRRQPN